MTVSKDVRCTITPEGVMLLDMSSGKLFSTNSLGLKVWTGLQDRVQIPQLIDTLCEEFGIARAIVESDVAKYLDKLKVGGLIYEDQD